MECFARNASRGADAEPQGFRFSRILPDSMEVSCRLESLACAFNKFLHGCEALSFQQGVPESGARLKPC